MLSDPPIQFASEDHAPQIAYMSRDYIEEGLGWSWGRLRVLAAIRDRATNVCVIVERNVVLAFAIMKYSDEHAHLLLLAVRPAQRRRRLASKLIRWLESVAEVAGIERIFVECRRSNDAARCLYLDLGYHERKIERGLYRGQEDGIRLQKWLHPPAGKGGGT
jgi:ribosomal-protein-alanine N-acetyltransferase